MNITWLQYSPLVIIVSLRTPPSPCITNILLFLLLGSCLDIVNISAMWPCMQIVLGKEKEFVQVFGSLFWFECSQKCWASKMEENTFSHKVAGILVENKCCTFYTR